MVEQDYVGIQVGDRIEHFKSKPESRMTYVVLSFIAMQELIDGELKDVVKAKYVPDYDIAIACVRNIDELNGYAQNSDGDLVKRFTVIGHNAMSSEERQDLHDFLPEIAQ